MSEMNNSLISKLVRVMGGVKNVSKNGRNEFQKYDYVTERDIIDSIRDNLIKENVFVVSSVINHSKEGDLTSIAMKHTFIDGTTGEKLEVNSLGTGSDKGDKGAYKAYTGAIKYMFLKNFLIPTGDDPEATDERGKSTGFARVEEKAEPANSKSTVPASKTFGFAGKHREKIVKTSEAVATDEF